MLFAIFSKFECYSKSMGLDHGYLWYLIMVDYGTSSWLNSYVWFLIMVDSKSMVRFHCWFKSCGTYSVLCKNSWYLISAVVWSKIIVKLKCMDNIQGHCDTCSGLDIVLNQGYGKINCT